MKGLIIAFVASVALFSSCKKECYVCHATCYGGDTVVNGDSIKEVCSSEDMQYLKDHNAHGYNGSGCPWTCKVK